MKTVPSYQMDTQKNPKRQGSPLFFLAAGVFFSFCPVFFVGFGKYISEKNRSCPLTLSAEGEMFDCEGLNAYFNRGTQESRQLFLPGIGKFFYPNTLKNKVLLNNLE